MELSIPVQADLVVLARLTAATVPPGPASGVEEIEDLRLAVEELCLSLVGPDDDGRLRFAYQQTDDAVTITCTFEPEGAGGPERAGEPGGAAMGARGGPGSGRGGARARGRAVPPRPEGRPRRRARARRWRARGRRWPGCASAGRCCRSDGRGDLMAGSQPTAHTTKEKFAEFAVTRDAALRDELITSHLGLAHRLARRFAGRGEPHEDLVQVASVALVKAVDRFDPERGVQFSTFAATCVIGELKRHFRDRGWAVGRRGASRSSTWRWGRTSIACPKSSATPRPWRSWRPPPAPARTPSWRRSRPARATGRRRWTRRTPTARRWPTGSGATTHASMASTTGPCSGPPSRNSRSGTGSSSTSGSSTG